MRKSFALPVAAATLALAGGAYAFGHDQERSDDDALIAQATVSIGQAVATAEAQSGGRAVEVELEPAAGAPVWVVTTVSGGSETQVAVDARSGAVTRAVLEDDDDGEDEDDDHREHGSWEDRH